MSRIFKCEFYGKEEYCELIDAKNIARIINENKFLTGYGDIKEGCYILNVKDGFDNYYRTIEPEDKNFILIEEIED